MPVVQIITTGGALASRIAPVTGAARSVMHPSDLLPQIPQPTERADVRLDEFAPLPRIDTTLAIVARLWLQAGDSKSALREDSG